MRMPPMLWEGVNGWVVLVIVVSSSSIQDARPLRVPFFFAPVVLNRESATFFFHFIRHCFALPWWVIEGGGVLGDHSSSHCCVAAFDSSA
uniref:Putative secreted protein n=1 Tax=Anopheles marajoara TaxID=58244 RepID=A0A2M4C9W7_9DIPT